MTLFRRTSKHRQETGYYNLQYEKNLNGSRFFFSFSPFHESIPISFQLNLDFQEFFFHTIQ